MGEGPVTSLQTAPAGGALENAIETDTSPVDVEAIDESVLRSELELGRRRFTWASLIAIGLTAVPFLWILWSDWGPVNPLRKSVFEDNFYDLQARAMFHGHLSLTKGAIGIEAFVHDGRTYTYFGLFPSVIRMPVLLVTSSLDGKLTASFMLLAWLLTGLFASLLLWRVRHLVRGDVAMGRSEAIGFGVLVATIMGGTIWMLLASTPFVFNEDIAWSICLTIGSIFALLGVIEQPSWGRVATSGMLIMCANLDRATTGWACVVGAGFIALWFLFGFGGRENRRWFIPVLAAGLIPLAVSCVVNYAKFGVFFGVSNYEQVWTHVNAYRRKFLAANHNAEEGVIFVPTNLATYLRPDGLGVSRVFPFVTLPTRPPVPLGGVLFDRLYRTASLPASTPFLLLLSLWGLVTAFRPKAIGNVARTRLLLLAAGSAGAALMLWGYIAPRYLGDFVPFLVLASAVATADIFRRLEGRRRSIKTAVLAAIAVVALFTITANLGMAVVPNEEWSTAQVLNFVEAQKAVSDITGHPLQSHVVRGDSLPPWGPAGQLYVIGNCRGLYISNGENYSTVPSQQFHRTTWMTVELSPAAQHTFHLSVGNPRTSSTLRLLSAGSDTVEVTAQPTQDGRKVYLTFDIAEGPIKARGASLGVDPGTTHTVVVTADRAKHQLEASVDGVNKAVTSLTSNGPLRVYSTRSGTNSPSVSSAPTARPTLCQGLIHSAFTQQSSPPES